MSDSHDCLRWKDYFQVRGQGFGAFWRAHLSESSRRVLFVLGRGFDPRATIGLREVASACVSSTLDTLALQFDEGAGTTSHPLQGAADQNWADVQSIVQGKGELHSILVPFRSADGRRVGSRNAANIFNSDDQLTPYSDIVVDISAMPRGIYFPLIARLLFFHDQLKKTGKAAPNIHVIVAEDPVLDFSIIEEGIDETASFLHPFEGEFNREATGQYPKVWIPILGERRTTQFDRIYDLVKPDEVCPVLPSPSRNPRRGDDIAMEYQDVIFDQLRIDPRNFIYASEYNPFEVYRQIRMATLHYRKVLGLIGGCKVALSALGSKLMSLGILLVAYELKTVNTLNIGIAHIECQGYQLSPDVQINAEPIGLWLAGECYG